MTCCPIDCANTVKMDIISLTSREDNRLRQQNLKLKIENEFIKIERLNRPADQEPQASEIALAVTQLRSELKVSVTFILDAINANLNPPRLSRSNYYYAL